MNNKPKIIVAGMCDTKFTELKFVAEEVRKAGGDVKILNCGCGVPCDWPDISLQEVLDVIGEKQENVFRKYLISMDLTLTRLSTLGTCQFQNSKE